MGSRWADRLGRRLLRDRIRILAYHDVPDAVAFEAQVRHLVAHYTPVTAGEMIRSLRQGTSLPPFPVWVTFDDGYPGVIETGQPVLDRYGVPATLFVCPGVIGTDRPFWWSVVRAALAAGLRPSFDGREWEDGSLVTYLKQQPDTVRRGLVERLQRQLMTRGLAAPAHQLRTEQLRDWTASGHDVGNHTWDHPCLDQCSPAEQERQIERAHRWLVDSVPGFVPVFAYPNGHAAADAETVLSRLGYGAAVGFDHRLADACQPPLLLSRLRVSADADLARFRAIVSGGHAAAFSLASRVRRVAGDDGRALPTE